MSTTPNDDPRRHRSRDLGDLDRPVVSAEDAFRLLHIDRTTGYKAIQNGTFPLPVVRIGRLIRIPTAALVQLLEPDRDGGSHERKEKT
jgi:predicted DNA-binding transcriptional regulator AlpA